MHFNITSTSFLGILAVDSSLAMQVKVRRHPDGHAKKQPGFILLVSLHGSATPQSKEKVSLDNFNRFIPFGWYAERELLGQLCEAEVKVWLLIVKFT
jgi:hypothetical protein